MKIKILIFLFAAGILTSLIVNLTSERKKRWDERWSVDLSQVTEGTKVLQIDLSGGIFYSPQSQLKQIIRRIDNASEDEETKGLFIRANSPGGSIAASQELYEAVRRFQKTGKPIITSVIDLCASGCYYAALPSTTIMANRGSIVGSIGVILSTLNMEELYKKIGIRFNNITSVEHKDMLSPARKMTSEERAHLDRMVSKMHEDFVSDVVSWRKTYSSERELRRTANGMVYTSDVALQRGLIDKIGDLRAAQEEMARVLEVDRKDIRFVKPTYQYLEDILGLRVMEMWQSISTLFFGSWKEWAVNRDIPRFHY